MSNYIFQLLHFNIDDEELNLYVNVSFSVFKHNGRDFYQLKLNVTLFVHVKFITLCLLLGNGLNRRHRWHNLKVQVYGSLLDHICVCAYPEWPHRPLRKSGISTVARPRPSGCSKSCDLWPAFASCNTWSTRGTALCRVGDNGLSIG